MQKVEGSSPFIRLIAGGPVGPRGVWGDVAKWLTRRSAKPLFPGSTPGVAFGSHGGFPFSERDPAPFCPTRGYRSRPLQTAGEAIRLQHNCDTKGTCRATHPGARLMWRAGKAPGPP